MKRLVVLITLLWVAVSIVNVCSVYSAEGKDIPTQGEFAVKVAELLGMDTNKDVSEICAELSSKGIEPKGKWNVDSPITEDEMGVILAKVLGLAADVRKGNAGKVTVINTEGNCFVKEDGSIEEWVKCEKGMKINAFKTGKDSTLLMVCGTSSVVKAKPNTEGKIGPERVSVLAGEIIVDVRDLKPEESFDAMTATTVCAVRGTIFTVKAGGEVKDYLKGM